MEANNAEKMREALRTLRQRFDNDVMAYQDRYFKFDGWHWHKKAAEAAKWRDVFSELRDVCDAALSAPTRNCDVGTAKEQEERFTAYCAEMGACERCQNCITGWGATHDPESCVIEWEQAPYKAPTTQEEVK